MLSISLLLSLAHAAPQAPDLRIEGFTAYTGTTTTTLKLTLENQGAGDLTEPALVSLYLNSDKQPELGAKGDLSLYTPTMDAGDTAVVSFEVDLEFDTFSLALIDILLNSDDAIEEEVIGNNRFQLEVIDKEIDVSVEFDVFEYEMCSLEAMSNSPLCETEVTTPCDWTWVSYSLPSLPSYRGGAHEIPVDLLEHGTRGRWICVPSL